MTPASSRVPLLSSRQLLVDVFLLPLEKWAKDLKAQQESDISPAGDISADGWAADFTQQGEKSDMTSRHHGM